MSKNDEAIAMVGKIETAATAKLAEGEPDQDLLETLTGLVINHAAFERDIEALKLGQAMIEAGVDAAYFETAATADRLIPDAREILRELSIRQAEFVSDDLPRIRLETSKGDIVQ